MAIAFAMSGERVVQPARTLAVARKVDVVVVGGGTAVRANRRGAKALQDRLAAA